jgi:hypothetical protein
MSFELLGGIISTIMFFPWLMILLIPALPIIFLIYCGAETGCNLLTSTNTSEQNQEVPVLHSRHESHELDNLQIAS